MPPSKPDWARYWQNYKIPFINNPPFTLCEYLHISGVADYPEREYLYVFYIPQDLALCLMPNRYVISVALACRWGLSQHNVESSVGEHPKRMSYDIRVSIYIKYC